MSNTLKYLVDNVTDDPLLMIKLQNMANDLSIGVFFHNEITVPHSDRAVIFNLGDTQKYPNCERLVKPWWFEECSTQVFLTNMDKLKQTAKICFEHGDVHIFLSFCDNGAEKCASRPISLSSFQDEMAGIYIEYMSRMQPTVHLLVTE